MSNLAQRISMGNAYTRSINLTRDSASVDLVRSYQPTSRATEALRQVAAGLAPGLARGPSSRALALIGPYGSGKSVFALFLSALLSAPHSETHQTAFAILEKVKQAKLAKTFRRALGEGPGFLRVQINGIPDSLVRQILLALANTVDESALSAELAEEIRIAARPGTGMDRVLALIGEVQNAWAAMGGTGLLMEIDELGKFLEYESYHPRHREIHLLQLLAEKAGEAHPAPLHLVVMLHQAFEHYNQRLGKQLRDEWQKVQGRFAALAFLEPAEQSLRIVAAAFEREGELPTALAVQLDAATARLAEEGALPLGLAPEQARKLFDRCYPLHPFTLLILPVLCQKVAQNERTLFSYLGSSEPFGLHERLGQLRMGDWIGPWELYDYFLLNQSSGFSDPLVYHRWIEVVTALERFDSAPDDIAVRVLKTIGLLNLIGAQRGLKASHPLLRLLFGEAMDQALGRLDDASIIHFRNYSQEYRVWQGSDFDLHGVLQEAVAEQAGQSVVETLEALAPLKPIVARRATIATGTLRYFRPAFTGWERWPPKDKPDGGPRLWFYLAEEQEQPLLADAPERAVVAVCRYTERLREAVIEWMALRQLPERHDTLHQDPVVRREHRTWLANAEAEATQLIRSLLEEPESLQWFWGGREVPMRDRRDLQEQLSDWIEDHWYPRVPLLRNELINRDQPSPSANTGRKRLLAAMIEAPDQESLGIKKTPAEKSLYLSVLKESGLHREEGGDLGFYAPLEEDPCRLRPLWDAISATLGSSGEHQVTIPELYTVLRRPPYGVTLGVLPVLVVAYLLAQRREVALYQEGAFAETLTVEQAELLCRRPELFALERFDLAGLRGELFDRYLGSVVGKVREDATLLDIVRPLVRFFSSLPEYTLHSKGVSPEAGRVREVFRQAKSPGLLLFDALPRACGIPPADFAAARPEVVEAFIQRLIEVLRELKGAYPALLEHWRQELNRALLDTEIPELGALRAALADRYRGLERYTPDRMGVGALARRLADTGHASDSAWLESIATLLAGKPPTKWTEESRMQAELRLAERGQQLRELEKLALAVKDDGHAGEALLVKVVDVDRGELSRVLRVSKAQRQAAAATAERIAGQLRGFDDTQRFAVIAALMERIADEHEIEELNDE